jgi:hypothetical protein
MVRSEVSSQRLEGYLNGRNIASVNHAKYLGVIFDKWITWVLQIEMIEAKTFRTFINNYPLFKVSVQGPTLN